MSYDQARMLTFSFGELDVADAPDTFSFKLPNGKDGTLKDVCFSATETFTATTTEAKINIGTASDPDAYASCGLGTTADTGAYLASENTGDILNNAIPSGTTVLVTCVAPTGGTPAGKGYLHIMVDAY